MNRMETSGNQPLSSKLDCVAFLHIPALPATDYLGQVGFTNREVKRALSEIRQNSRPKV